MEKLRMNMLSYQSLNRAHELAVRQNELYESMQIVEQCGASPELTEAVVRLGNRLREIQTGLENAVRESITFGWRPNDHPQEKQPHEPLYETPKTTRK